MSEVLGMLGVIGRNSWSCDGPASFLGVRVPQRDSSAGALGDKQTASEEDDRVLVPRFRSASTDLKHRTNESVRGTCVGDRPAQPRASPIPRNNTTGQVSPTLKECLAPARVSALGLRT